MNPRLIHGLGFENSMALENMDFLPEKVNGKLRKGARLGDV
jgi:hypothetical protein